MGIIQLDSIYIVSYELTSIVQVEDIITDVFVAHSLIIAAGYFTSNSP